MAFLGEAGVSACPVALGGASVDFLGDLAVGEHSARGWASLFSSNTHQVFNTLLSKYPEQLPGSSAARPDTQPLQARPRQHEPLRGAPAQHLPAQPLALCFQQAGRQAGPPALALWPWVGPSPSLSPHIVSWKGGQ